MERKNPKSPHISTKHAKTTGETSTTKDSIVIDKRKKAAVAAYQEFEADTLTPEEKNSKIPLIIAFLAALALIVGLSIFLSQVNDHKNRGDKISKSGISCDINSGLICGKDGRTYQNACVLESSRVLGDYPGECMTPTTYNGASTGYQTTAATGSLALSSPIDDNTTSQDTLLQDIPLASSGSGSSESSLLMDNEAGIVSSEGGKEPLGTAGSGISLNQTDTSFAANSAKNTKVATYTKSQYGYSYSFPRDTYYQGLLAPKGATHAIALKSGKAPTNRDDSDVIVTYYQGFIAPELAGNNNIQIGSLYYLVKGDSTFVIEKKGNTAKAQSITDTILSTLTY